MAAQPGNAAFAASTARPTSAAVANGTRLPSAPVAGREDVAEAARRARRALAADPVGEGGNVGLAQGRGGVHGGISRKRAAHDGRAHRLQGLNSLTLPRRGRAGTGKMRASVTSADAGCRRRLPPSGGRRPHATWATTSEQVCREAGGTRCPCSAEPRRRAEPYPDVMGAAAATDALADAGVAYRDVQQAYVGYVYGDSTAGQKALYRVGMTGIPVVQREQQLLDRLDRALPRAAGGRERRRRLRAGARIRADGAGCARHAFQRSPDAVRRLQPRNRCAGRGARRAARDPLLRRRGRCRT